MALREGRIADAAAIEAFEEMGGNRLDELAAGLCQVAEDDGQVVAYASHLPHGLLGQPVLTYLCVAPAYRRRGLARALVQRVQQLARGRKLIASTEDWCIATQRLFAQLGWSEIGRLATINKDGSVEIFYAVDLPQPPSAAPPVAGTQATTPQT